MRTEARLFTRIWDDDPDWIARSFAAQWAYMMLISQRDLEHHGGIALRIPRWSHLASDMTEPILTAAINELAEHRFIVVDRDYGELFVRSLVREDRVYKQPNILRSAADRLGEVRSPVILAAMHAELLRVDDLPDLTETCRLIVKEMLEATLPGGTRPVRRPRRRPSKTARNASANPSADTTVDARGEDAANPSGKGSPAPSANATGSPSGKGSAYRAAKPTGKATAKRSSAPKATPSAAAPKASASTTPSPHPKAGAKATPNPSGTPSTNPPAKPRPHPSAMPNPDGEDQQHSAYRTILANWLRSTGNRMPTAAVVEHVERLLDDALHAGEPATRIADVLHRWQREDGTDPARLATMIANAADPDTASAPSTDRPTGAADGAAPASGRMGGWALEDLTAATVAITNPWLAALTEPPTGEQLDDIEYHVSRGLIEGARPEHIAASLAAWHASGSTDLWQLTDLINAETDDDPSRPTGDPAEPSPPAIATAAPPVTNAADTPTTAEEWLATAKAQP